VGFQRPVQLTEMTSWSTKKKRSTNGFPLFSLTIPFLEKISGIVRHHWKEIEKSESLEKLFHEPPIVAFRQPKSVKDTLVRTAVSI
jgi:hypothetical protein